MLVEAVVWSTPFCLPLPLYLWSLWFLRECACAFWQMYQTVWEKMQAEKDPEKKRREMERERKETKIRIQAHSSFDMAALNTEAVPALSSMVNIGNGVWIMRCSPGKSAFVEAAHKALNAPVDLCVSSLGWLNSRSGPLQGPGPLCPTPSGWGRVTHHITYGSAGPHGIYRKLPFLNCPSHKLSNCFRQGLWI